MSSDFRTDIHTRGLLSVNSLVQRAGAIETILHTINYTHELPQQVANSLVTEEDFSKALPNSSITALLEIVHHELRWASHHLWAVQLSWELHLPRIDDGGNFGVQVLASCLDILQNKRELTARDLRELPRYHQVQLNELFLCLDCSFLPFV
jgi:hypothetical protein